MEIQQHDGVVVEVAGFQQGFAKRCGRREMCHGRERGGAALALPPRKGAAKGGVPPPQGTSEVPSPFRTLPFFPSLGAWASWGWCPWPI